MSLVVEAEAQLLQDAKESDYTSSESSSDDEPLLAMGQLWSKHYFTTQGLITKDFNQLYLLLHNYKINWPEIFRSFLCISPGCFDAVVEVIKDDEIFQIILKCQSNSNLLLQYTILVIMRMLQVQ